MTSTQHNKHPHVIPDDCKPFISEEAYAVLEANKLAIDIQPSVDFMLTYSFPFVGVYDQIGFIYERCDSSGIPDFTVIKNNEFGATDDETAQNVIKSLGLDLAEVQYWLVYVTELEEANEKGLTKVFTLSAKGLPADKTHFAGFGWKYDTDTKKQIAIHQPQDLLRTLAGIEYLINDMVMGITLRDADDGMFIVYYEAVKAKGYLDQRLIKHGARFAETRRESENYLQEKAVFNTRTHVVPNEHQSLVTDETKDFLEQNNLLIKLESVDDDSNQQVTFKLLDAISGDAIYGFHIPSEPLETADIDGFNETLKTLVNNHIDTINNRAANNKAFLESPRGVAA